MIEGCFPSAGGEESKIREHSCLIEARGEDEFLLGSC